MSIEKKLGPEILSWVKKGMEERANEPAPSVELNGRRYDGRLALRVLDEREGKVELTDDIRRLRDELRRDLVQIHAAQNEWIPVLVNDEERLVPFSELEREHAEAVEVFMAHIGWILFVAERYGKEVERARYVQNVLKDPKKP